ncbi:MAG: recombination mediator RecR [Candidatus Electrothrix sp. GW3-4]|uniref:recombination mediator RecR n=1 Tax=Candidatus Electrothrix sp. GW3-4 TaxID=3126740 RepID=UPI0030CD5F1A
MQVVPPALERLMSDLTRLPGIGQKTASRLALYLLRRPPAEALNLSASLAELHSSIQLCSRCFAFSENDPCRICEDARRNNRLVCVVEEPGDLLAIEKTGAFRGVYHILHGVLAPMEGIGPDELKIRELFQRVRSQGIEEILIATSSTVPGEATASYLIDHLSGLPVKVTRLACGIPMGMDIKYADEHTLSRAIESRQFIEK